MIRSCTIHELPASSWYGDAAAKLRPTRRRNFRADMAFFFFSPVAGFSLRLLANIDTRTQCRIGLYKIQEATRKTQAAWKNELPAIIVGTPLFCAVPRKLRRKSKNTGKKMFGRLQRSEHFSARSGFLRGKWHVRGEKRARKSEKASQIADFLFCSGEILQFRGMVGGSGEASFFEAGGGKKPSTTSEISYARISRFDFSFSRFSTLTAYCYEYLGEIYKNKKLCRSAYFSRFQETYESSLRNLSSPSCTLLTEGPSSPGLTSLDQKWERKLTVIVSRQTLTLCGTSFRAPRQTRSSGKSPPPAACGGNSSIGTGRYGFPAREEKKDKGTRSKTCSWIKNMIFVCLWNEGGKLDRTKKGVLLQRWQKN